MASTLRVTRCLINRCVRLESKVLVSSPECWAVARSLRKHIVCG